MDLARLVRELAAGPGARHQLVSCGADGCPRQLIIVGPSLRKFAAARLAALEEGWKLGHRVRCPHHAGEVRP